MRSAVLSASSASSASLDAAMSRMGRDARAASRRLARASSEAKDSALGFAATALRDRASRLVEINAEEVDRARAKGLRSSFVARLRLDAAGVESIASSLESLMALPDPVGTETWRHRRSDGLEISRVLCPIGVIGAIYEARPNVTAEAAALCLKSGNAAILRSGSAAFATSREIAAAMREGLVAAGLPESATSFVETTDRRAVGAILGGLGGCVDVVVPRGGKDLVSRVESEARVPTLSHLEGVCHVYVDSLADGEKARRVVLNAKMRRVDVCGAAEGLLLDESLDSSLASSVVGCLLDAGCEVRGDAHCRALDSRVVEARDSDWGKEHLEAVISARGVSGVEGALEHIERYGSGHTDAIVTEDVDRSERFLREVDGAIVLSNASTQFADGGEFGFGAEIGIATGRLHARGPIGLEQLTICKYAVRGDGHARSP